MNAKVLSLIYGYWLFDGVHTSKGKSVVAESGLT